jgi:hypothetical protein
VPINMTDKIKKVAIARPLLLILIGGSFSLGIFMGAGMGVFTPLSTIKSESVPEGREGAFKYIRESMDAKDAQGRLTNKELKPFQYKVNALIEGYGQYWCGFRTEQ